MSDLKTALERLATPFEDKCEAISAKEMLALLWSCVEAIEFMSAGEHDNRHQLKATARKALAQLHETLKEQV